MIYVENQYYNDGLRCRGWSSSLVEHTTASLYSIALLGSFSPLAALIQNKRSYSMYQARCEWFGSNTFVVPLSRAATRSAEEWSPSSKIAL